MLTNRIYDLRTKAGKTQQQVVEEITRQNHGRRPFNRTMLSHYEKGRCQPGGVPLALLCRYFQVSPGEILVLAEEGEQPTS